MVKKAFYLAVFFSIFFQSDSFGQFHLPPMEISFKGGSAFFRTKTVIVLPNNQRIDRLYDYWAPTWQGEIRWNFSQYVSLGFDGSFGSSDFKYVEDPSGSEGRLKGGHSTFGGSLRFSTGRKPRVRPFVEFGLGKFNLHYTDDKRVTSSGGYVVYSLGLMIKASKNLYVVLPQVNGRHLKSSFPNEVLGDFAFGRKAPLFDVSTGLVINFGKRG